MNIYPDIETHSTDLLLDGLKKAVIEAQLVRAIIKTKDELESLKIGQVPTRNFLYLNRKIELLKSKLERIRE